jgi:hypothetical protein
VATDRERNRLLHENFADAANLFRQVVGDMENLVQDFPDPSVDPLVSQAHTLLENLSPLLADMQKANRIAFERLK